MWCAGESSCRQIWFWGRMDSTTFEIWQFLFYVRRLLFSICFLGAFLIMMLCFHHACILQALTHTHTHILPLSPLPGPGSICMFISMCNRTNLWCINYEKSDMWFSWRCFCVYLYMYYLSFTVVPSISQNVFDFPYYVHLLFAFVNSFQWTPEGRIWGFASVTNW